MKLEHTTMDLLLVDKQWHIVLSDCLLDCQHIYCNVELLTVEESFIGTSDLIY